VMIEEQPAIELLPPQRFLDLAHVHRTLSRITSHRTSIAPSAG
jgi:hypothetical protein